MSPKPSEKAFENHFCHQLEETSDFKRRDVSDIDKELCLNFKELEEFLSDTQPEEMKLLKHDLGQGWKEEILKQLRSDLQTKKQYEVLRDGITINNKHLSLLYTKPAVSADKEQLSQYKKNRFTYVRQYTFEGQESLDIVLFINGFAVVTIELKNEPTGQTVYDAIQQYLERDLTLPIFTRPFLHIAADNNRVKTATEFKERSEKDFKDFNEGLKNAPPKDNPNEYPVHYLYHNVLTRDSLLSIIDSYLFQDKEKATVFPRYHQRRCTDRIVENISANFRKTGKLDLRYLIQHSAGSGKSNTIVWMVQNLRNLYVNDKKLFSSIIVLTDRINLDDQISRDFRQAIDQKDVVAYCEHTNQLADAIKAEKKVIVSTMQKFTFVKKLLEEFQQQDKRICFVIDESHRSQEGSLHESVTGTFYEQEELIGEIAEKKFPNAVFIALTATPSDATLRHFGVKEGNQWKPFDVYSMDEAIKEGYILDVVKSVVPYETLYELNYKYDSAKEYPPLQIYRALKQKAYEDDDVIKNKVNIILTIFEKRTARKIGGKAKAMIVTTSRLAAVKYQIFLNDEIKRRNLPYHSVVAFTGTVEYNNAKYTEAGMNEPLRKSQRDKTEDTFDKDDSIRFIIVANKFQTGFNQPKLHTMFLDKAVSDINAVQTISRLNRIYPSKDDTLVVDFTDSYDSIIKAFKKFQANVVTEKDVNPDNLAIIYQDLLKRGIFTRADIVECKRLNDSEKPEDSAALSGLMSRIKQSAITKYQSDKEELRKFRTLLGRYIGLFDYVKAIFQVGDQELVDFRLFAELLYRYLDPTMRPEELEAELKHVQVINHFVRPLEYELGKDHTPGASPKDKGTNITYVPKLSTVKEVIEQINNSFKALTGSDVATIEAFITDAVADPELVADVRSNMNNDKETVFREVLKEKLESRYRTFVLNRSADRYTKLTQDELMAFVQRNAYTLLHQNAL